MKKILILGSNGYIGRNVTQHLSESGTNQVLTPKRAELNLLNTQSCEDYVKAARPDVIVHAAVNINSIEENVRMYFNFERLSQFYGKMIVVGSGAEYDLKSYKPLMPEEYFGAHTPSDTYGLSKFIISSDIEHRKKNIVNLRVFAIYGKHEDFTRRFISNNICNLLCGRQVSVSRNMAFDYLYVDDFLRIMDKFIDRQCSFANYNICTSRPVELIDLARMILEVMRSGDPEDIVVRNDGMGPEYSGSNARFLQEFGPFEFTDHKGAIADLSRWYREHLEELQVCSRL